ncbi:transposase [uncultured Meiothermus sp.]|uniref:transposase n=1 Tax=uncultured Meiothermus sp. TaxID=157471 RepID=UPI003453D8ED
MVNQISQKGAALSAAKGADREVGLRVREIIRQVCREMEVEIRKGHVARDHVHVFVSIPLPLSAGWCRG